MAGDPLILWSHALAALLFGALGIWAVRREELPVPAGSFAAACALTALWALAVAGIGGSDVVTRIAEALRNFGWLGFMLALLWRGPASPERLALGIMHGVLMAVVAASGMLAVVETALDPGPVHESVLAAALVVRMIAAVGALVLVHNLHFSVLSPARGKILLVTAGLGAMWLMHLVVITTAFFGGDWPSALQIASGLIFSLLVPMFAIGLQRRGGWTVQLSRTVAYQSISLIAVGAYLLAMGVLTRAIGSLAGTHERQAQVAFAIGSTAALLAVLANPRAMAWIKVKVAKHFFRHRYDYRAEWLRFTDTLGRPGEDDTPLGERVVKAVAELVDSPGGLLLVPEGAALGPGAAWNWHAADAGPADEAFARMLTAGRIVELQVDPGDAPLWMLDRRDAWAVVPLVHFDGLAGAILLARPPIDRRLDWEDFDLLKTAGRQVASYLAEERAHAALSDARRFDEFNRRFAFILHDIKNLVSQLSLVARNAERHADNPDFRADMIATLHNSAERMTDLLARLSQHQGARAEPLRAADVTVAAERVAMRERGRHPVAVTGDRSAIAHADPARLEQILGHLVQNAIDASPADEPVTLAIQARPNEVSVEVIDKGKGMSPAFVRDQLFRPFVSSKPGGFGLGAFEARQLAVAMGGRLEVTSREGEGSRFRLVLAPAQAGDVLEQAA
ncbi:PEP-CTERM system histidine kinase PrsK [soil metagenome]